MAARIVAASAPVFEPLDPIKPRAGRIIIDRNDPEGAAHDLGLSERDTERFIEWVRALRA